MSKNPAQFFPAPSPAVTLSLHADVGSPEQVLAPQFSERTRGGGEVLATLSWGVGQRFPRDLLLPSQAGRSQVLLLSRPVQVGFLPSPPRTPVAARTGVSVHWSGRVPRVHQCWGLLDRAAGLVLLGTGAARPPSTHACDSWLPVLATASSSATQEQAGEDLARVFSISGHPGDRGLWIWEDASTGPSPSPAEGLPRCQLLVLALPTPLPIQLGPCSAPVRQALGLGAMVHRRPVDVPALPHTPPA